MDDTNKMDDPNDRNDLEGRKGECNSYRCYEVLRMVRELIGCNRL